MISVITGDVIHSRRLEEPGLWSKPLKGLLETFGPSPETWEVYRGDSFQLELERPAEALRTAIRIKALMRRQPDLDVRMAIGIGEKQVSGPAVTESQGQAFVYSGETLEHIKKNKRTLAIKTPWKDFDREINLLIRLGLIAMDTWSPKAAEIVSAMLEQPGIEQQKVSGVLGIAQSSASERLKRAHFDEILELELFYREKLQTVIDHAAAH